METRARLQLPHRRPSEALSSTNEPALNAHGKCRGADLQRGKRRLLRGARRNQ